MLPKALDLDYEYIAELEKAIIYIAVEFLLNFVKKQTQMHCTKQ